MDMTPSTTAPSSPHAASEEAAYPPLISDMLEEGCWHAGRPRHDGWTPERLRTFLETLAACGVVADACRAASMSPQSAYALRNRRAGRGPGRLRRRARARRTAGSGTGSRTVSPSAPRRLRHARDPQRLLRLAPRPLHRDSGRRPRPEPEGRVGRGRHRPRRPQPLPRLARDGRARRHAARGSRRLPGGVRSSARRNRRPDGSRASINFINFGSGGGVAGRGNRSR